MNATRPEYLSGRVGAEQSKLIKEILKLKQRPEIISFAGKLDYSELAFNTSLKGRPGPAICTMHT